MTTFNKNISDLSALGSLDSSADKIVVIDATDSKPKLITADAYNTAAGISSKEDSANKSTNVVTDILSDVKFPTTKAVATYVTGIAAGKENSLGSGTTGQYLRGDKTFQTLDKTAVGLSNVQNVDQTNAGSITSGTLSDDRLSSNVLKTTSPFNLNNQPLFNYRKNIFSVATSGIFQINNSHHGSAIVIGHSSGTSTLSFLATVQAGADFDIWINTTQNIEFTCAAGMTIYVSNGVTVTNPSAYTVGSPQRGKRIKAFCPSINVILLSGDVV